MDNGIYYNPTKILFGRDMEAQIGEEVAPYAQRVLLVSGRNRAEQAGLLGRVRKSLEDAGIHVVELPGVQSNPVLSKVWEGIRLARQEAVSLILAVGGGSVIDTAKAIACGAPNTEDVWNYFEGKSHPESVLPVGVVLTIAGAGSESSNAMVIRNDSGEGQEVTRIYYDDRARPVVAVLDPVSTFSLPAFNTACGIADACCHVLEKYFTNTKDVEVTDRLCEGVIQSLLESSMKAIENPRDYHARSNIMWASKVAHDGTLAVGRERDTAVRLIANELTSRYNLTNGAVLAVLFPYWLEYVKDHQPERMQLFAERIMGSDPRAEGVGQRVADYVRRNFDHMGLPSTLSDLGVSREDLGEIADVVTAANGGSIGKYVVLDRDAVCELLEMAAGD